MTRAVLFYSGLVAFGLVSFTACGSSEPDPIGDDLDASARSTSGSRASSAGGTFNTGTSSSSSSSASSSSGTTPQGNCTSTLDCTAPEECIPDETGALNCTDPDGSSTSSGSTSSSGGNPSGNGLGESCDVDGDCQSGLCITSKDTGILFCSKTCTKSLSCPNEPCDNYDAANPADATNCPSNLPRCGDEGDRPNPVCRADI